MWGASAARTRRSASCSERSSRKAWACSTASRRRPMPIGGLLRRHGLEAPAAVDLRRRLTPRISPSLARRGQAARAAVLETPLPDELRAADPRGLRAAVRAARPRAGAGGALVGHRGRSARSVVRRRGRDVSQRARPRGLLRAVQPASRPCSRTGRSAIAPGSATTSSRSRCRSASCRWCAPTRPVPA